MSDTRAVHECLFCSQTFDSAATKDDHVMQHFAAETCVECNRNLIRIGCNLYVKHDASICSIRAPKSEEIVESSSSKSRALSQNDSQCSSDIMHTDMADESVKIEQPNAMEDSNASIDYDLLDEFGNQSSLSNISESDGQSITSDIEFKLQEMLCKREIKIDAEQIGNDDKETENKEGTANLVNGNKFECKVCGNILKSKFGLSKHTLLKHSPDTIFCNICARIFSTIADRDMHRSACAARRRKPIKKAHPDLRCDLCETQCDTEKVYRSHMLDVHDKQIKLVKCKHCSASFLKKSWLIEHQCPAKLAEMSKKIEVPRRQRGTGKIQCDLCFKKFLTSHILRSHMRRQHDSTIKKFKCSPCGATFLREFSLKNHNCPKSCLHPCDICGAQLANPNSLRMHKIRLHSPPTVCDICTQQFPTVDERNDHRLECALRRKLGFKEFVKFECYICKKEIGSKHNLLIHMRRKHDTDKFICNPCGRVFMRESSIPQHRCKGRSKNTKSKLQEVRIPCEFCGKVLTWGSMRAHKTVFHSPASTIYCKGCFKVFPTVDELNPHQTKCISKRNSKRTCNICGVVLASVRSLTRHRISLHSSPDTIFCRTCVKKFKTTDELDTHIPECTLKRKLYKIKSTG